MSKPLGIMINEVFGGKVETNYLRTDKCPAQRGMDGCAGEALEPHVCPYNEDVNGDSETLCTCCENCTQGCCADI